MKRVLIGGAVVAFFAMVIPLAILLGFKFFAPAKEVFVYREGCHWSWPEDRQPFGVSNYYWWDKKPGVPCRFDQHEQAWKDLRYYYVMYGNGI